MPAPPSSRAAMAPRTGLLVLACVLFGGASLALFAVEAFLPGALVLAVGGLVAGGYGYLKLRSRPDERRDVMAALDAAARTAVRGHPSGEEVAAAKAPEDAARHPPEAAKASGA